MSDSGAPEAFRHDGFGRKVGPLPIWGWALVLAAGVYIFYRFYAGRSTASSSTGSAIDQSYATNGSNASTQPYAGTSTGNGTGSQFGSFNSNDAYNAAAIGEAAQFGATPLQVQSALGKYENGQTLSTQEGGIINSILAAFGGLPTAPGSTSQIASSSGGGSIPSDISKYSYVNEGNGGVALFNPNTGKSAHIQNIAEWQYIQSLVQGHPIVGATMPTATQSQQALATIQAVQ